MSKEDDIVKETKINDLKNSLGNYYYVSVLMVVGLVAPIIGYRDYLFYLALILSSILILLLNMKLNFFKKIEKAIGRKNNDGIFITLLFSTLMVISALNIVLSAGIDLTLYISSRYL